MSCFSFSLQTVYTQFNILNMTVNIETANDVQVLRWVYVCVTYGVRMCYVWFTYVYVGCTYVYVGCTYVYIGCTYFGPQF